MWSPSSKKLARANRASRSIQSRGRSHRPPTPSMEASASGRVAVRRRARSKTAVSYRCSGHRGVPSPQAPFFFRPFLCRLRRGSLCAPAGGAFRSRYSSPRRNASRYRTAIPSDSPPEAVLSPVAVWVETMPREVALQCTVGLAVDEANQRIGSNRFADFSCGWLFGSCFRVPALRLIPDARVMIVVCTLRSAPVDRLGLCKLLET